MHEHATEELFLIVTFLCPHSDVMEGRCQALLDQSVEDMANSSETVILIDAGILSHANGLLLPVLESFCLIEIEHAIDQSRHHSAGLTLIEQLLSDRIPELLQLLLLVSGDDLLVPTAQIESDLRALEPLLQSAL